MYITLCSCEPSRQPHNISLKAVRDVTAKYKYIDEECEHHEWISNHTRACNDSEVSDERLYGA